MGGDGGRVERRPPGPAGVRDTGPLARVVDVGSSAVDADGAHQRAAEPGREADVVQRVGQGVALSHESSSVRGGLWRGA